jgi:hypothetical protein
MNRIGKTGRANAQANKKIREHIPEHDTCELVGIVEHECAPFAMTTAHRHKRAWYGGDADLLADKKQWIRACVTAHDFIENDRDLTKELFTKLRGKEI